MSIRFFILLDLGSQADAVLRYTDGWTTDAILSWMRCYGTVLDWSWKEPNFYVFYAPTGLYTGFNLTDQTFTIFAYGTTRMVRRHL